MDHPKVGVVVIVLVLFMITVDLVGRLLLQVLLGLHFLGLFFFYGLVIERQVQLFSL